MVVWRPQNRSNREKPKKALGVLPKGILTPSFIEIAPAVTKRALLVDDGHVIAIAHQGRGALKINIILHELVHHGPTKTMKWSMDHMFTSDLMLGHV
jgi:hypothetical protein